MELPRDLGQIVMAMIFRLLSAAAALLIGRAHADPAHIELAAWHFNPISANLGFQKDIAERVKQGFDKSCVVIPRPQQDVYLVNVQE